MAGRVLQSYSSIMISICTFTRLIFAAGSSGSGKTTLIDCLSGRKSIGRIEGDVLVNGRLGGPRRCTGHVAPL
jgi:ABC-type lipoprotein export system ATPase subunit